MPVVQLSPNPGNDRKGEVKSYPDLYGIGQQLYFSPKLIKPCNPTQTRRKNND